MRSTFRLPPILGPLRELAQRLGPYVLIELLLPGGTLVALLLYLARRAAAKPAPDVPATPAAGSAAAALTCLATTPATP